MLGKLGEEWTIFSNVDSVEEKEDNSIWLRWKRSIWDGSILSSSRQHIHGRMKNGGGLNHASYNYLWPE